MMVDADHLRIVFRVNGVGFVMPVADLLAIRGGEEDELQLSEPSSGSFQSGTLHYREMDVAVYDLAALFKLGEAGSVKEGQRLIFAGSDGPWAVSVDLVSGVVPATDFCFRDVSGYMLADGNVPYSQVALHDNLLLVSLEASQVESALGAGV